MQVFAVWEKQKNVSFMHLKFLSLLVVSIRLDAGCVNETSQKKHRKKFQISYYFSFCRTPRYRDGVVGDLREMYFYECNVQLHNIYLWLLGKREKIWEKNRTKFVNRCKYDFVDFFILIISWMYSKYQRSLGQRELRWWWNIVFQGRLWSELCILIIEQLLKVKADLLWDQETWWSLWPIRF